jgi:hypothetical protein
MPVTVHGYIAALRAAGAEDAARRLEEAVQQARALDRDAAPGAGAAWDEVSRLLGDAGRIIRRGGGMTQNKGAV